MYFSFIYMHIYIYIYGHAYIRIYICVYARMHVCFMYVWMYVRMYVYAYVCACMCTHACTGVYTSFAQMALATSRRPKISRRSVWQKCCQGHVGRGRFEELGQVQARQSSAFVDAKAEHLRVGVSKTIAFFQSET